MAEFGQVPDADLSPSVESCADGFDTIGGYVVTGTTTPSDKALSVDGDNAVDEHGNTNVAAVLLAAGAVLAQSLLYLQNASGASLLDVLLL